ncbi:hypothetical protein [Persicobacter psychrovividus]|uniref:Uncharacterized protein n=1 Tax=Persicobacter psychrovividus TaxID=387638 RepID=A0ABM7VHN7_9BACT|nr:hypothetical protein PEPS_27660 [Persicobacter psychrovividus]
MKKHTQNIIFYILLLLSPAFAVAQSSNSNGLRFISHEAENNNRTGISFGHDHAFSAEKNMSLSFDLKLRPAPFFGNVVRIIFNDKNTIDLSYSPPSSAEGEEELILVGAKKLITTFPLTHQEEQIIQWQPIKLMVDSHNKLSISYLGKTRRIDIPQAVWSQKNNKVEIYFGKHRDGKFVTTDVADMSVRNIELLVDNKTKHFWPLNEIQGNLAHATKGKIEGHVSHPSWEANHHFKWQKVASLASCFKPGITFEPASHTIHIINKDFGYQFNIAKSSLDSTTFNTGLSIDPLYINSYWNPITKKTISYDFRQGELSHYDGEKNQWETTKVCQNEMRYWHHNLLYDSLRDEYITFGGYGFFKYKNHFLKYDRQEKTWNKIRFKGDTIPPRYLSSSVYMGDNKYLLFGGMGNHDGRQALGTVTYLDLYQVDLTNYTVKRLWQKSENENTPIVPAKGLVLDADRKHFYALTFDPYDQNTKLELKKFAIKDGSFTTVSNAIPFKFKDIRSDVKLFFDYSLSQFVAVTRSTIEGATGDVGIFTLNGPPMEASAFNKAVESHQNRHPENSATASAEWIWKLFYTFLGAGVALILAFFGYKFYKPKSTKKPVSPAPAASAPQEETRAPSVMPANETVTVTNEPASANVTVPQKVEYPRKNAIFLFGGLEVFNQEGLDISHKITPKLKQILLLIICYPYNHGRGISSSEMTELIWPTATKSSGKNNRSISIRRLRLILDEIDGVEIIHEQQEWKLQLSGDAYCDLSELLFLKSQLASDTSKETQQQIMSLIRRGALPTALQAEWLDDINNFIVSDTIKLLTDFAAEMSAPKAKIQLADTILHLDDLDEQGLEIKILALLQLNKIGQAQSELNRFKKRYHNFFGEEYKKQVENFNLK